MEGAAVRRGEQEGTTMSTMALDAASSNRRELFRRTVIKGARIVYNDRKSTLDCRIRDMSEEGARIDLMTQQLLPHEFELQMAGTPARRCGLCWARGTFIGVRFLEAA
jgi:hypothetical protein